MTRRFAGIIQPVLGEFDRKSMERAFVQSYDKPLHDLSGEELQRAELLQAVMIDRIGHGSK
jgi:hypothetical protein